jgi:transposase
MSGQKKGKWLSLFKKRVSEPDTEWEFIDGSYVKAHQHSAGASGADSQSIGKRRAENTTNIHLAVDSDGLPIEFTVTGGEIHNSTAASELIEPLPPAKAVVADKGYDSEKIREQIKNKGANAVIPRRSNSVLGNADMDGSLYRHRHLVENAFARLKHFRGLATCYDKLKRNYQSGVAMACGFL